MPACRARQGRHRHHRQLDASVGASGPHGFAVREVSALVSSATRVHRIPPRVRDDRDTPLVWDETAKDMQVIWGGRESKYFCEQDWTGGQISGRTVRAVLRSLGLAPAADRVHYGTGRPWRPLGADGTHRDEG
jgi:hypothetical protein